MNSTLRNNRKFWLTGIFVLVVLTALPLIINQYMIKTAGTAIIAEMKEDREVSFVKEQQSAFSGLKAECILVLGAGLKPDGTPNHMLEDRLETAFALYKSGAAPKLLLSGDHGRNEYDEVNAMKGYMLERGVPKEDIFLDLAGFSTYDSMYRAKAVFQVNSVIVVTQRYHQYRALYLAEKLGYKAYGVCSDQEVYMGQTIRNIREILARNKDFFKVMIKPAPSYLGDIIPISGSGLESWE
ncbi:SanA/YdcF family protein [Aminipila luticellarii]|uniref:SanA protein n=1 Tax=Aminipila luticellarii TaxID=2507160 RepID=A0A410PUM1_9FIRM|nr:ElyC/SanA/YdcF family protein [Aminipila luticellarii]QAT42614.1 SanA protein [Aminipila luticellarii]